MTEIDRVTPRLTRRTIVARAAGVAAASVLPGSLAGTASAAGRRAAATSASSSAALSVLVGESFWDNWDPYDHFSQVQFGVQRSVFDRLVELGPGLNIQPGLAESYRQVDPRTWEFKLRSGLHFQNGAAFTASDVKASVECVGVRWQAQVDDVGDVGHSPGGRNRRRSHDPAARSQAIRAAAEHTRPDRHRLQGRSQRRAQHDQEPAKWDWAFQLVTDGATTKSLRRFAGHYSRAQLAGLSYEFVNDPATRLSALLANQANVIDRLAPDQVPEIRGRSGFTVDSIVSLENQMLWLRADKPPFNNVHARRALAWGIDRQAVARVVGGKTHAADSHLPIGILYHQTQKPAYTFDPSRAKAELALAGLTPPVPITFYASTGNIPIASRRRS